MVSIFHCVCARNCPDTCSLIVKVNNEGKIIEVRGNKAHPITKGFLCGKIVDFQKYIYHKDRIKYPLIRTGKKGFGQFKRISFKKALEEITKRIEKIIENEGSTAILDYSYSGHMGLLNRYFPQRFFNKLNAAKALQNICSTAGTEALRLTHGTDQGEDPEDIPKMKLLVLWGVDPARTYIHEYALLLKAKANGAKIYIIDPIKTRSTQLGVHLQIKPNTDQVLAYAVANYLIRKKLIDYEFIAKYTTGFRYFRQFVKKYTLELAEEITTIPAKEIERFANDYAQLKPSIIHIGYGMQRQYNGGESVQAISLLPPLIGLKKGFIYSNENPGFDMRYLEGQTLATIKRPTYSMVRLGRVLPFFKMIFVYNANPLATLPNQELIRKNILKRGIFIVVADLFLTDTAYFADIILPSASFFECLDIHVSYWHRYILLNEKAIKPIGEARSNTELFRELSRAMGFKDTLLYEEDEEIIENLLKKNKLLNLTYDELKRKKYVKIQWTPPFRKIDFAPVRAHLKGFKPIPPYRPIKREGFQLLTPVHKNLIHSQYDNLHPISTYLEMNPNDAKKLGIRNGEKVKIKSEYGEIVLPVKYNLGVKEGVVLAYSAPWPRLHGGKNINFVVTDELQLYGCSMLNSTFVKIEKIKE